MKVRIYCLFLVLVFAFYNDSISQDTLFSYAYEMEQPFITFENPQDSAFFDFDTPNQSNLWQIGPPSKTVFDAALSSDFVMITDTASTYPMGNQSSFEFVVKTDDYTELRFWHQYDTDLGNDGGVIEVSMDEGNSWTNIVDLNFGMFTLDGFYGSNDSIAGAGGKRGFSGSSQGWKEAVIYGSSWEYIRFRFSFFSDSTDTQKDGWMIDDFRLVCLGTAIEKLSTTPQIEMVHDLATQEVRIFPGNGIQVNRVEVFSLQGKLLYQGSDLIISSSVWSEGVYIARIQTQSGSYRKKFFKKNF